VGGFSSRVWSVSKIVTRVLLQEYAPRYKRTTLYNDRLWGAGEELQMPEVIQAFEAVMKLILDLIELKANEIEHHV
jgi:hypothetical protein